jgi:hypothetical protein
VAEAGQEFRDHISVQAVDTVDMSRVTDESKMRRISITVMANLSFWRHGTLMSRVCGITCSVLLATLAGCFPYEKHIRDIPPGAPEGHIEFTYKAIGQVDQFPWIHMMSGDLSLWDDYVPKDWARSRILRVPAEPGSYIIEVRLYGQFKRIMDVAVVAGQETAVEINASLAVLGPTTETYHMSTSGRFSTLSTPARFSWDVTVMPPK